MATEIVQLMVLGRLGLNRDIRRSVAEYLLKTTKKQVLCRFTSLTLPSLRGTQQNLAKRKIPAFECCESCGGYRGSAPLWQPRNDRDSGPKSLTRGRVLCHHGRFASLPRPIIAPLARPRLVDPEKLMAIAREREEPARKRRRWCSYLRCK